MFPATALALALVLAAGASQATRSVEFDGSMYTRQFVAASTTGGLAEYVPASETLDNWTTLIGIRNFPQLDDPGRAAVQLAKTLKESNPLARFQLLVKEDQSEAMIDFLTWQADAKYAKFNVFRYLKRPGYPGLIAYQFAYRLHDTSPEASEQFKQDRQRWVEAMSQAEFPVDFDE